LLLLLLFAELVVLLFFFAGVEELLFFFGFVVAFFGVLTPATFDAFFLATGAGAGFSFSPPPPPPVPGFFSLHIPHTGDMSSFKNVQIGQGHSLLIIAAHLAKLAARAKRFATAGEAATTAAPLWSSCVVAFGYGDPLSRVLALAS